VSLEILAAPAPRAIVDDPGLGPDARSLRAQASDYLALTKPRIVLLVVLTTAAGFWLGARASGRPEDWLWTLLGTALVAAGASAWNHALEWRRDARMRRTARRPVPQGRIGAVQALVFGSVLALVGVILLAAVRPLAAGVAGLTFLLYVAVYTPLKPVTTLNTAIGAVPGALPPVIGWSAATGSLGMEAWSLFLIVFLWQFPHFLSIAWVHRQDYARGGHRMLPLIDPEGRRTGQQSAVYALILVPGALLPAVVGLAGPVYFAGALVLSLYYLAMAWRFWWDVRDQTARALMRASFIYLPAVFLLLVLNPLPA
jgi:protoheme IX farnesyltransferase